MTQRIVVAAAVLVLAYMSATPVAAQTPDPAAAHPPIHGAAHDSVAAHDTMAGVHYRIYRPNGDLIDLQTVIAEINNADVVLVGEEHDDPIAHFLQLQLLQGVHSLRLASADSNERSVLLSLEMFEADVQSIVDEYLDGFISEKNFLAAARPWQNYQTDYRPAVEYAKEHGLTVIAANAPRRYASRVTSGGPEALLELPDHARAWLPPLPYRQATKAYIAEWNKEMEENGHGMDASSETPADQTLALYPNMLAAQSLWDAKMAYSIANGLMRHPGSTALHFVGSFHVNNRTGIPEHLTAYRPGTKIAIVSIATREDVNAFESDADASLGDYIILTDESLPRSHDRR